jgi:hypothetical protein
MISNATLRTIALILAVIGGEGNLIVAAWYIWKKKKPGLGVMHVAISAISLLILLVIF